MYNCLHRAVTKIHCHVAGMCTNQERIIITLFVERKKPKPKFEATLGWRNENKQKIVLAFLLYPLSYVLVSPLCYHLFCCPHCFFPSSVIVYCSSTCPSVPSVLTTSCPCVLSSLLSVLVSQYVYYLSWCLVYSITCPGVPSVLSIICPCVPSALPPVLISLLFFAPFVLTFTMLSLLPSNVAKVFFVICPHAQPILNISCLSQLVPPLFSLSSSNWRMQHLNDKLQ